MWIMMLISYSLAAYIDTRGLSKLKEKRLKPFYIMLMTISCIIGTAAGYVKDMPSPAEPIKNFIISIVGR